MIGLNMSHWLQSWPYFGSTYIRGKAKYLEQLIVLLIRIDYSSATVIRKIFSLIHITNTWQSSIRTSSLTVAYDRRLITCETVSRYQGKPIMWIHPLIHFSAPREGAEPAVSLKCEVITYAFTHSKSPLPRYHMFRCAFRPFSRSLAPASPPRRDIFIGSRQISLPMTWEEILFQEGGRYRWRAGRNICFNWARGCSALRAASPFTSASAASAEDRCKHTFFLDSQHFGFGKLSVRGGCPAGLTVCWMQESSSYPRRYVPSQIPRQTESKTSPATFFLSGMMHERVLDGTLDGTTQSPIRPVARMLIHDIHLANFALKANATTRNLASVLRQLKEMWFHDCFICRYIGYRLIYVDMETSCQLTTGTPAQVNGK